MRYVDAAVLSQLWNWLAGSSAPIAAIVIPAASFLSVVSQALGTEWLRNPAYIGVLFHARAGLSLGAGLIRAVLQMAALTSVVFTTCAALMSTEGGFSSRLFVQIPGSQASP